MSCAIIACRRSARPARSEAMASQKRRIIIADEVSQDVKLTAFEFAGQLDARDQLDTPPCCLGPGHGQGRDRVMVGNGECAQPHSSRGHHDLARRADSVGMSGVHVQIGSRHEMADAGKTESQRRPYSPWVSSGAASGGVRGSARPAGTRLWAGLCRLDLGL